MTAYITTCFSDWQVENFSRGIMAIVGGRRTDRPIRRPLRSNEKEGVHWYRKADPDFDQLTYTRCHRSLRSVLRCQDVLFFRTLWRGDSYIIGYMTLGHSLGPENNRRWQALRSGYRGTSKLVHFQLPVTVELVRMLNPRATTPGNRPLNQWVNENLGRDFMHLSTAGATYLMTLMSGIDQKNHYRVGKQTLTPVAASE